MSLNRIASSYQAIGSCPLGKYGRDHLGETLEAPCRLVVISSPILEKMPKKPFAYFLNNKEDHSVVSQGTTCK